MGRNNKALSAPILATASAHNPSWGEITADFKGNHAFFDYKIPSKEQSSL
ncbi:Uncharacterized protein dnm_042560 [Desulfonema magnum]|uniref:Uncharacterized protein n=1 Tax=Desulfonema magnum TaxID=45655 RepID=A0A975GNX0_9BACT|nr:Uncharacterized protein dnm_042560 [Desulfonema magnum]